MSPQNGVLWAANEAMNLGVLNFLISSIVKGDLFKIKKLFDQTWVKGNLWWKIKNIRLKGEN